MAAPIEGAMHTSCCEINYKFENGGSIAPYSFVHCPLDQNIDNENPRSFYLANVVSRSYYPER